MKSRHSFFPAGVACPTPPDPPDPTALKPAVDFLKKYGATSVVSLGCGNRLNRIDNHLRLLTELCLEHYVGIDCDSHIEPCSQNLFMAPDDMNALLKRHYQGRPERFWNAVRVFPTTFVEELAGITCAVVICQRVYPDFRWEEVIKSMNPLLVLQEDLHGCERQQLRGPQYVRTLSNIRKYGLRPFRPWPIFPGETNLVLWRRRDFGGQLRNDGKFEWLRRLGRALVG